MTSLTFYPLGNADTCNIALQDGRRMLVDFAAVCDSSDSADKRCDLPVLLDKDRREAKHADYVVVAFTHLDDDHCKGSPDYFWLQHAEKYQEEGKPKIGTMWVPAAAITEEGLYDDARIIRQEARHRLREGEGIIVFSRPERLKDWFKENRISMDSRRHCFVDAGDLVPGFTLNKDGVEFFAHSPHASRSDENGLEDRNGDSLVFQARFREDGTETDVLFAADVTHEVIAEIVDITRHNGNDDRLCWNVYKLPHHCSYTAIGPEKGADVTEPVDQVRWLCEDQGLDGALIISTSKPIPKTGSDADGDKQPPHRQAANYYTRSVVGSDAFLVTMEHPNTTSPKPIVVEITKKGASRKALGVAAAATVVSGTAPRAG